MFRPCWLENLTAAFQSNHELSGERLSVFSSAAQVVSITDVPKKKKREPSCQEGRSFLLLRNTSPMTANTENSWANRCCCNGAHEGHRQEQTSVVRRPPPTVAGVEGEGLLDVTQAGFSPMSLSSSFLFLLLPNQNVPPDSQLRSGWRFTSFNKKGLKGRITAGDVMGGGRLVTRRQIKTANLGASSASDHETSRNIEAFVRRHHPFFQFGPLSPPRW